MRRTKIWLFGVLFLAGLGGAMFFAPPSSRAQPGAAREERREERSYWRHHDGRWSHWDARDKRWYYTDGTHWYAHNGRNWELYRFDRNFGRDGFERGQYMPPPPNVNVVLPNHAVYVAPR